MTSLDRPVVPDVGIMTARSRSSTFAGPRPVAAAVNSSATSARSTAQSTSDGRSLSVTTRLGMACCTKPASSSRELFGLTGTWTAPTSMSANQTRRYSGVFRAVTRTRSPGPTPAARSALAARSIWSIACEYLYTRSPASSQVLCGAASTACRNSVGIVRFN